MVMPVLADGPKGKGAKLEQAANGGQPAGGAQSGDENPGQAGQAEKGKPARDLPEYKKGKPGEQNEPGQQPAVQPDQAGQGKPLPDQASSQDNPGQGRSDQAGCQGQQGQGKAQPDRASSRVDQAQARQDQAGSQGGRGKAKLDSAGSQGKRDQARLRRAGSHGKKGRAKADAASSHPSPSKAEGRVRSEERAYPDRPELANNQMGRSRSMANQATASDGAFTQFNGDYDLCRSTGKPQTVSFHFSEISQGGGVITISNSDGLKNLRITVNGQRFQVPLGNPTAPTMVDVDVSSALPLDEDEILFTALGKPGACAMVLPAP